MEYIYASLLLHVAKKEINEENLRRILDAAGIQADEVRIKMVVTALKEINIDEVIKTAAISPMAVAPATAPAAQPQATTEASPPEAKKEEEAKKEISEEELAAGLSSLFG